MDGDPAVEPELDSFSRTLPLPYRVALTVVLGMYLPSPIVNSVASPFLTLIDSDIGVWAWGANLQYLTAAKIVRLSSSVHALSFPPQKTY